MLSNKKAAPFTRDGFYICLLYTSHLFAATGGKADGGYNAGIENYQVLGHTKTLFV